VHNRPMTGGERSVLDLLRELGAAFGIRYGELTIRYEEGEPMLLRQGMTLKPEALALMPAAAEPPAG